MAGIRSKGSSEGLEVPVNGVGLPFFHKMPGKYSAKNKKVKLEMRTNLVQLLDLWQGYQGDPPKQWQLTDSDTTDQKDNRALMKETLSERKNRIEERKDD